MKQIVLITGSTRGIGLAISARLTKAGYTVITHGSADFDVSNPEEVQSGCEKLLNRYHHIDILINNAGILHDRTLVKMTDSEWDSVIKTNLYGPMYVTRALIPQMIERKYGRIINISSIIGQKGNFGQSNYAASKAGLIGFTKSIAIEVAKYNITVNAVCPGLVDTGILSHVSPEILSMLVDQTSLKRLAKPDEIAHLVNFLASKESAYITGAVIDINGGWR